MNSPVRILGPNGQPLAPSRAQMLAGGSRTPYDAASNSDAHMAAWQPYLWSPDAELNMYRDRIVARVRDMVRNDGWASGAVTRILDNAIGADFRPIAKPDYHALATQTGIKAFDADWADEFGRKVEANWRIWSNDMNNYSDAQRSMRMSQMFYLGFRHKLVDGDALAMMQWLPKRVGPGRARYASCVQLIDPDRLSNPQLQFDQRHLRGGVEVDEFGVAVAYHIRAAHQGDWWAAEKSVTWERVPRETKWGRPIIIHDYDRDRAAQHRGGAGVLAPILQRMKMLIKYDSVELDAAIVNAVFGAYVQSPFDSEMVENALGNSDQLSEYQSQRAEFHAQRKLSVGDVRMPTLFPGESINTVSATRPNGNFKEFEGAVLRNAASALGVSAQQMSQDWSSVNYSSARAAMLEAWKTLTRRRTDFAMNFCRQIYSAWLEESFDVDDYPLPPGAPAFIEARAEYTRALWVGPGRGWVDPVAEKQGAILGMQSGMSTLESEAAENAGLDYEEVLDQRARERQAFKERDLPEPPWMQGVIPAQETIKKTEAI